MGWGLLKGLDGQVETEQQPSKRCGCRDSQSPMAQVAPRALSGQVRLPQPSCSSRILNMLSC